MSDKLGAWSSPREGPGERALCGVTSDLKSFSQLLETDGEGLLTAAKSLQSCPTLCDPRDSSPPGSPVPGILQARTLEWAAISFSTA